MPCLVQSIKFLSLKAVFHWLTNKPDRFLWKDLWNSHTFFVGGITPCVHLPAKLQGGLRRCIVMVVTKQIAMLSEAPGFQSGTWHSGRITWFHDISSDMIWQYQQDLIFNALKFACLNAPLGWSEPEPNMYSTEVHSWGGHEVRTKKSSKFQMDTLKVRIFWLQTWQLALSSR